MTDYKNYGTLNRRDSREVRLALLVVLFTLVVMGLAGNEDMRAEQALAVPVAKSDTQLQIETLVPEQVAAAIVKHAPQYPRTMAAIAHTESRGNHRAVGDGGASKGLFQVQDHHWQEQYGPVPDTIEGQVEQATRIFLTLCRQHGYRKAVALWNGSPDNPAVKRYQRTVLAKVQELQ